MATQSNHTQESSYHLYVSPEDDYDFVVTSDGSGHYTDMIGAWAAIVTSKKYPQCGRVTSVGCCTHTETGRAEFLAILTGLHTIITSMQYEKHKSSLTMLEITMPTVLIISDRKDLVDGISGETEPEKNLDLWYQFSWYTKYFDIKARHIPGHKRLREEHERVDCLSGLGRLVLCDFVNIQKEIKHIRDEQFTTTDKTDN